MNVWLVASECHPWITTGGLGDMVAGLAAALAQRGWRVTVVIPGYGTVMNQPGEWVREHDAFRLWHDDPMDILCVAHPALFERPGTPYQDDTYTDWPDNAERFGYFGRRVAEWVRSPPGNVPAPDIVHTHDWQAGLVSAWLNEWGMCVPSVLTIHNVGYHGLFSREQAASLALPMHWWTPAMAEFHGRWSWLKAGIMTADRLVTVSHQHVRELLAEPLAFGLSGVFVERREHLSGVLNGFDDQRWNPRSDPWTVCGYDAETLHQKHHNRRDIQGRTGLPAVTPVVLIGVVSRLAWQKGLDMLPDVIETTAHMPLQWIILGEGDPVIASNLRRCASRWHDRVAFLEGFDEAAAHRILAGCDAICMPSRYEPCGLVQQVAMHYGTLPIVADTGGLHDTVVDARDTWGTGFLVATPTVEGIRDTLGRVVNTHACESVWRQLQRNAMAQPAGWARTAAGYTEVYESLIGHHTGEIAHAL